MVLPTSCTGATEDQHAEFVDIAPNLASVGASGPVKTTVSWTHAAVEQLFMDTLEGLGVPNARDAYGGDVGISSLVVDLTS